MSNSKYSKRHVVSVETPPCVQPFRQYICQMTDKEIAEGRSERPDLVFRICEDGEVVNTPVQNSPSVYDMDNPKGISVRGMALPSNLEKLIEEL